jgi:hypothetical protein
LGRCHWMKHAYGSTWLKIEQNKRILIENGIKYNKLLIFQYSFFVIDFYIIVSQRENKKVRFKFSPVDTPLSFLNYLYHKIYLDGYAKI